MITQTSERLNENAKKILVLWEKRAKTEIKAATNKESLVLRNALPEQLKRLSDALSTTIDRTEIRVRWDLDENSRLGKLHGLGRASMESYTIDQLIFEYHILREVIFEVMDEAAPLSSFEREIITCSIEQSVNDAATEFSSTQTKIQQELIHTLAHDLRGPITAAKIISQQLQRKFPNDDSMFKRITKYMDRLDLMIQDLLDVAKLKAGERLPLEFKESDMDLIVGHTIEDLNFIYNNRFKYITSGECIGFWSVKGLQRLLENLAINAVKHGSLNDEITIILNDEGENVSLSVHNEGDVIPPEDQKLLFEQSLISHSSEEKVGWGLGLVIVNAMAQAHNGTVEVESVEGKGTTFTAKFPKTTITKHVEPIQYELH